MVTSNFRQTIEALFGAIAGSAALRSLRRSYVFGTLCIAFGSGAALGALASEVPRAHSLAAPVMLLVMVAWLCEHGPESASDEQAAMG